MNISKESFCRPDGGTGKRGPLQARGDRGRVSETASRYDSYRAVYLSELQKSPDRIKILEAIIALMKKWAAEGK